CGLIEPSEGTIEIDGVDLATRPKPELWASLAVMFQEPVRYQATVRDNVRFGDLASDPGPSRLRECAREAGLDEAIEGFEAGWETFLGTWFESGRDLSVGQWQRLALARVGLRRAPLLLLDEPTSAMDVWSEAAWFERLREVARGRTVVLITHRLTAARHADRVHVLDRGQSIESGSHESLIAAGGRYAESWQARPG
ncbi:MAG: ABC transporter ATP-binding protein, partial [Acidobacteriota bacterium]